MPWWAWLLAWAASMVFLWSLLRAASRPTADEIDELIEELSRRRGLAFRRLHERDSVAVLAEVDSRLGSVAS